MSQMGRSFHIISVAFGASSPYGKATHYDLCVASLLQIVFAATPEGEPSFLLTPPGEVPRSGQGVSKRTGAQGAIATEHPVRRHPAQSVCIGWRSHLISFYAKLKCITRHNYTVLLTFSAASPREGAPGGKRLTVFSVACGSLRTPFACHPNGVGLADGD